jgi:hypothetical protein
MARYDELPRWSDAEGPVWRVRMTTLPFPMNLDKADRTVVIE